MQRLPGSGAWGAALAAVLSAILGAFIVQAPVVRAQDADATKPDASAALKRFVSTQQRSTGTVTIGGQHIDYVAYAGTIVVHPMGWDDVPQNAPKDADKNPPAEASMFYVAYFRVPSAAHADANRGAPSAGGNGAEHADRVNVGSLSRPVTFIYNGGPGSPTMWLHMGAFGPQRVAAMDHSHTPAAPYALVNNQYSLLDVSDLVFVDAPGTGFSRISGTNREKAFYGVDQDAWAFSDFIQQFLAKYNRWNSPKYLFGESYGTTRSALLVRVEQAEHSVDFNGVILMSQILNFGNDIAAAEPQFNPGVELPYELALPTYAATAWYHHKLPAPQPQQLAPLLQEVEQFAMGDYAQALSAGGSLPDEQRAMIAQKLHQYTGLPLDYILKADLRINSGEFEKTLQADDNLTIGRLDTRFSGPTLDPLSKAAEYDPQSAALSSAYVLLFNDYVRTQLHYGQDQQYITKTDILRKWDFKHGVQMPLQQVANVMPDLATAIKTNPNLQVLLNAGYFDLATPFYEGVYEMRHLPIPASLRGNIQFAFYESGHMVYAHEPSLKELHTNVAAFIQRTAAPASSSQPPQTP